MLGMRPWSKRRTHSRIVDNTIRIELDLSSADPAIRSYRVIFGGTGVVVRFAEPDFINFRNSISEALDTASKIY